MSLCYFREGKVIVCVLARYFTLSKNGGMEILFHMSGWKLINFILARFCFFFGFTIPLNLFLQLRNFLIYSIQFNIQDTTRNFINISIQPNDTQKTLIFITKSQVKLKRDNHNGSSQCSKKANDLMIKPTQLKRYEKTNHQKTKLLSDISNCLLISIQQV